MSRLFKIQLPEEQITPETDYNDQSEHIKIGFYPNFKNWLLSWVPSCCNCNFKRSRKEVAMQLARDKLSKEVNVVEMIR